MSSAQLNSYHKPLLTTATPPHTRTTNVQVSEMLSFSVHTPQVQSRDTRSRSPDCYETYTEKMVAAARRYAPKSIFSASTPVANISLDKRKEFSTQDETVGDDPGQQSPARVEKQTLWDSSLPQNKANKFVLLSASQKGSADGVVAPSLQYGPNTAPTCQSEPAHSPPPNACGHTIHPAYSGNYAKAMCPMCLVDASMNTLRHAQDQINAHGGLAKWHEEAKGYDGLTVYCIATAGGKKKGKPRWRNEDGTDVSYRNSKRNLVNFVTELEGLSKLEVTWEEKQSSGNNDVHNEQVRSRKQYSATAALHWYNDTADNGFIGRIEEDCELFSRRRGRRWIIASDPAFPDRHGREQDLAWGSLKKKQKKVLRNSSIPKPQRTDVAEVAPRRKRRREDATVSFNEDVYVRTDADVDVLRKASSSLTEEFLERPVKKRRLSILRTTPLKIDPEPTRSTPLTANPEPPRPYYVIPLSRKDGPARDVKKSSMERRKKRWYTRGQWAVPKGSEPIDTSGCHRHFDNHLGYAEKLRMEAVKMDLLEHATGPDGDTEMQDAPSANAQEATPQPSLTFPSRLMSSITSHWVFAVFSPS